MKTTECCSGDCLQGRDCPRRGERRKGQSVWRKVFHWLLREQRDGWDRRARVDTVVEELQSDLTPVARGRETSARVRSKEGAVV